MIDATIKQKQEFLAEYYRICEKYQMSFECNIDSEIEIVEVPEDTHFLTRILLRSLTIGERKDFKNGN